MGQNAHPLPPVIESGRLGAIRRISNERTIKKPTQNDQLGLPPMPTMAQVNQARQKRNRETLLMLLKAGVSDARKLSELTKCSASTVWNHLKPMEAEGLIIINRALKPWPIKLTRKGMK
jgi:hypothetical protein